MPEALVELNQLLMHHCVAYKLPIKLLLLSCCRQFAMQKGITTVREVSLLGQIIDVVSEGSHTPTGWQKTILNRSATNSAYPRYIRTPFLPSMYVILESQEPAAY